MQSLLTHHAKQEVEVNKNLNDLVSGRENGGNALQRGVLRVNQHNSYPLLAPALDASRASQ